jgi:signal transduction histidine kinase
MPEPTGRRGSPGAIKPGPRFPDGPKLELDELLSQLIGRAQDVVSAQGRLRGLLRANQAVVGNLALPILLKNTVKAACELAHARYGALGVIDASGGLEQFVHVGMDDEVVAGIGHLPDGKGLLRALIDNPHPIRLDVMARDPRSVGFPAGHPPMTSFLGVPIRVRDEVFGNLYLTERDDGEFTLEDEELVSALAATAGVAIENSRLYDEARRRQLWLQASTEVSLQLLSTEGEDALVLIARQAREIADADVVTVVLPTANRDRLVVEVAAGEGERELAGSTVGIENSLVGVALAQGRPVLVADMAKSSYTVHLSDVLPIGPVMVLPLRGPQRSRGALVIGRLRGRHRFADADLEMATTFAGHAAVALELADSRTDQQRLLLLEDRDRIARDLHDHVIQRLFAIGLTVQSVASGLGADPRSARLSGIVSDIDETIRQTRTSIFQLRGPLGPETGTVRSRVLTVIAEVSPLLGFDPRVQFTGPIDAVVPEAVVDDLDAVLREALTNTARHAVATRVDVELTATTSQLWVDVVDDGVGVGTPARFSGLDNLRKRAGSHGGSMEVGPASAGSPGPGTRLHWTIPLPGASVR